MNRTIATIIGSLAAAVLFIVMAARSAGTDPGGVPAEIATLQAQVASLQSQVSALQANNALALAPYVTVSAGSINGLSGPHVVFHGANVHIESGSGTTVDSTGLGNLVIGYNEDSTNPPVIDTARGGSHNLIVGDQHQFT